MPLNTETADIIWVLQCATLVMLMQGGFCLLESGLSRSKNSISVAFKNLLDFCIAGATFWAFGFAFMFGATKSGFIGSSHFVFDSTNPWMLSFFVFQMMFCGTATTIISGAIAERTRFRAYLVMSVLVSGLIYPVFGHWAWGGAGTHQMTGWLNSRGFIDFAGSSVVHSVGGWVALAAVIVVGPRLGRFDNFRGAIQGHNMPIATFGVLVLWFGWFGFNGGSTLSANNSIALILVNTHLAATFGGLAAYVIASLFESRPGIVHPLFGVIAGLVAITASCHIVSPASAALIGSVGGTICYFTSYLLPKLRIDDAIGAVPAHAVPGVWGTLAVALFGDLEAFGIGISRWEQLLIQAQGTGVCFIWSFGVGFILLHLLNRVLPLRVPEQHELVGLNVSEHGDRSEMHDLLDVMSNHHEHGDFTSKVPVEPHTEVGQIAAEYNRVIDKVNAEINERHLTLEKMHALAYHDTLTGLPNRASILQSVQELIDRCSSDSYALLFIDFDRFKLVNDSLGHDAGDVILKVIAQRIRDTLAQCNADFKPARLAGDEFVILIESISGQSEAVDVADRLLKRFADQYEIGGQTVHLTASIGIAHCDASYTKASEILRDADLAMYQSKNAGRAVYTIFDQTLRDDVQLRLKLENDMRDSLNEGHFLLVYQPIVSLESGCVSGAEALLRWQHPTRGLLGAEQFVSIAEETGVIVPIGYEIVDQACHQIATWRRKFWNMNEQFCVHVNISRKQLLHQDLVSVVKRSLGKYAIPPECLHLEVTETIVMDEAETAIETINRLRQLGVKIDIDDFGTGYSSLSCIHEFPIDLLKIDRVFIANMEESEELMAILQAVLTLADNLKMPVVAEGIEKVEQLAILKRLGCKYGQGYLFAKPMLPSKFEQYLEYTSVSGQEIYAKCTEAECV